MVPEKMVPRENCRKVSKNFLTLFDDFCPARKLSTSVEKLFDTSLKTLTSLNKEVRVFFLSDNSIWSLPSVSSLSDYSISRF